MVSGFYSEGSEGFLRLVVSAVCFSCSLTNACRAPADRLWCVYMDVCVSLCSTVCVCVSVCVCHSQCAFVGCLRSHAGCVLQEWIHTYNKRMKEESDWRVCVCRQCVSLRSEGSGVNVR